MKKTRSNDNYGGVAICYRKYIKMKKINHNFDSEVVIVRTLNLDNNFVICSVYFKPDMADAKFIDSISNIFDFLEMRISLFVVTLTLGVSCGVILLEISKVLDLSRQFYLQIFDV